MLLVFRDQFKVVRAVLRGQGVRFQSVQLVLVFPSLFQMFGVFRLPFCKCALFWCVRVSIGLAGEIPRLLRGVVVLFRGTYFLILCVSGGRRAGAGMELFHSGWLVTRVGHAGVVTASPRPFLF